MQFISEAGISGVAIERRSPSEQTVYTAAVTFHLGGEAVLSLLILEHTF